MEQKKFIGRKAELQRLEETLKKACDGHLQVVFFAGEAGVGKSSLVGEFIRGQEQGNASLVVPFMQSEGVRALMA